VACVAPVDVEVLEVVELGRDGAVGAGEVAAPVLVVVAASIALKSSI
jgi:hypothetical protein